MPIKSYLAFPQKGMKDHLHRALGKISGCEIVEAKNREVLIVLSDTTNQEEEDFLIHQLQQIKSLHHLNLVAGFNEDN